MLFDAPSDATQVIRLEKLFLSATFRDVTFTDELRVEIDGYDLSMVSQPFSTSAIAGPTWIGVLLKLIHSVKKSDSVSPGDTDAAQFADLGAESQSSSSQGDEADVEMELESERVQRAWVLLPPSPVQPLPSPPHAASPPMFVNGNPTKSRQAWHYAVLFKASTHPFPGTLSLKKGFDTAVTSEDVAKYFPLEDRLLIGKDEYFAKDYNPRTLELQLGTSSLSWKRELSDASADSRLCGGQIVRTKETVLPA